MSQSLGSLERVDVRKAWTNEAVDFTPWLASEHGLKLLGEALGMDLEVEATEQSVGPFAADILAKRTDTPEEHWVVIENQLEKTDHRHLGQLLTYAAGLKAATVIWVAAEFTPEHRATIDWLNTMTTDRLRLYGLEIELWRIGTSPHAPKFNIVAAPNEATNSATQAKDSLEAGLSPTAQLKRRYWTTFLQVLLARKGSVKANKAAPSDHWIVFSIGRGRFWLNALLNTKDKNIGVDLTFNGPLKQGWFDKLHTNKDEIEKAIGHTLVWLPMLNNKSSRIALFRESSDPAAEGEWPIQHAWLAETLERFHKVFKPYVAELPDVPEALLDEAAHEPPEAA